MLKFNSWPPQAGEVEFTENSQNLIQNQLDGYRREIDFIDLAGACGELLISNTDIDTAREIRDSLVEESGMDDKVYGPMFKNAFDQGMVYKVELIVRNEV